MNQAKTYFEKNGYVVLENALDKEECNSLVEYMFYLKEQGKLTKDEQCPLSDAIYGDPVFDAILEKFAKPIGDTVGKTLIPTYTYARIYRPGEVLSKHTDRPSCEISATLTLGYKAKQLWPIYFDETKEIPVLLEPGELAVYKGCEVVHWRTAFKGEWHVQVFLHYVDAHGPYKDYRFDKRTSLSNETKLPSVSFQGTIIPSKDDKLPGYISVNQVFTNRECEKIVSIAADSYPSNARVGSNRNGSTISKKIRAAQIYSIDNSDANRWIFERIGSLIRDVNHNHFDYEISGITHSLQLIHYEASESGHYDWHVDAGPGEVASRKISLSIQLSDPSTYEGCDLIVNDHGKEVLASREQGSAHLFPSYMLHKVTPVVRGNRYALVIWVHGSRRFR